MAIRIVGVDLPQNKRGEIALTYIFGIGRSSANKILAEAGVDKDIKVKDWTDDQAGKIREIIGATYKVEGDLRSEVQLNIKRLMDIGCYRGIRHRSRNHTNQKTYCDLSQLSIFLNSHNIQDFFHFLVQMTLLLPLSSHRMR